MNSIAVVVAAVALWGGTGAAPARAQCFDLPQLLGIGSARLAVEHPESIRQLPAAEWQLQRAASPTQEIVWTSVQTTTLGVAAAEVRLRPLPGQPTPDVLLKTTQAACLRQVRSALKSQGVKPVPVTCPNCEAQRYQAPEFVATFYSGLKGDFPYLLVVHPVAPPAGTTAPVSRE